LKDNAEVSKEIEKKIREHKKEIEVFQSSSREDTETEE
jgi:recombination protein RecA